ncbi:hypothetical protein L1077_24085 [Pseudoalteromonas luteoviolacea]|uniref:hypothetical protein n=1 Tax=Pseudoalteromonas luteoviolacea TaxID=43657 RepID=UPI001F2B7326|nr:hypothetical protein [Pseudoalteromonas luteoviolacea]MCF6442512.1 hypothetical protein [Pseudoalteromonas luteoviolacea]
MSDSTTNENIQEAVNNDAVSLVKILNDIREVHPNTECITGEIISLYYYKRQFNKKEEKKTQSFDYAYWWVEVKDENGNIIQTSISSESDLLQNLKKGDLISLISLLDTQLTYDIVTSEARNLVTNNSIAEVTVIHGKKSNQWIMNNTAYPHPGWSKPCFFTFGLLLMLFSFFEQNHKLIMYGMILTPIVFLIECLFSFKSYNKEKSAYKLVLGNLDNLSDLLGKAARTQRPLSNSPSIEKVNSELCIEKSLAAQALVGKKRKEQERLASMYVKEYTETYEHNCMYDSNYKADVYCRLHVAKVIDTNRKVNVNNGKYEEKTYSTEKVYNTETNYIDGQWVKETSVDYVQVVDTHTYETRSANMVGHAVLESLSGKVLTQRLPEKMLSNLDIGDWVIFADSHAVFESGKEIYSLEYFSNIDKHTWDSEKSFMEYEDTKCEKMLSAIFKLIGMCVLVAIAVLSYQSDWSLFPALALIPYIIYYFYKRNIFCNLYNKNIDHRRDVLNKISVSIDGINEDRDQIKAQLSKL